MINKLKRLFLRKPKKQLGLIDILMNSIGKTENIHGSVEVIISMELEETLEGHKITMFMDRGEWDTKLYPPFKATINKNYE